MKLKVDHLLDGRMKAPVMRGVNGIQLLNLLRQHGPLSRASLAKLSHLSKPTVSDQIAGLLRRKLVVELGLGESTRSGGKKPTLVAFNAGGGRVASVQIAVTEVKVVTADLAGHIRNRVILTPGKDHSSSAVLRSANKAIRTALGRDLDKLRAIGVAVPGRVDPERGVILQADNVLGWRDVDIRTALRGSSGIPVEIDNDVNLAALGEWRHALGSAGSMVFVQLDTGLGAGIILNGGLYRGARSAAGEVGHMHVGSLDVSKANPRGSLESVVAADRVLAKLRKRNGRLADLAQPGNHDLRESTARHLAAAIANIAALYDPTVIALSGEIFEITFARIERLVRNFIPWPIELRMSVLGQEAAVRGALDKALETAYRQIATALAPDTRAEAAG